VIVPDANLLIYSTNQRAGLNRQAREWLESVLSGSETVGFAWNVLLAFIRLSTRPGMFEKPLKADAALDQVDEWISQPGAIVIHPGPRHAQIMRELLSPLGVAGDLTSDAHLAALAIEHSAELCSADSDFARFAGLRWRNPLAAK
jgi:toxin-antitoxin system PIN domain toxin